MKQSITPFTEPLYDLYFQALEDEDEDVSSNAAFATGMLAEHSGMDLSPRYPAILSALRPMFSISTDAASMKFTARDNATGAVSRSFYASHKRSAMRRPCLYSSPPCRFETITSRTYRSSERFSTSSQLCQRSLCHTSTSCCLLDPECRSS